MFLNLREKIFVRTQENQKLLFSAGAPINISLTFMTNLQVLQFSKFRAFIKKKNERKFSKKLWRLTAELQPCHYFRQVYIPRAICSHSPSVLIISMVSSILMQPKAGLF